MPPIAMNTAPLKRTLSVTGLLLTGAASGVVAIKVVAPAFLSPGAAEAQTVATGGEGGGGGNAPTLAARTTVRPRLSAAAEQVPAPRQKAVSATPTRTTGAAQAAAYSSPTEKPSNKSL
jgi:hypothetical protein